MKNSIKINSKIKSFNKQIFVDSDKSISIRSLIFGSLATGNSKIKNLLESEDIKNTIQSLKKLGVKIIKKKKVYHVNGLGINKFKYKKNLTIDAGNSGTLARLLFSLLIKSPVKIKIKGDKSLSKRDFNRIIIPLSKFGAKFFPKNKTNLPLSIKKNGNINETKFYEKKGSAQVKSAIMLASLYYSKKIQIIAKKSRNHTENFFKFLKIPIKINSSKNIDKINLTGAQKFKSFAYDVPSDISSALFFVALAVLTKKSKLTLKNVNINYSRMGSIEILKKMGVKFIFKNKKREKGETISDIIVKSPKQIKPIDCPKSMNSKAIDEFLIIFLIATKAKGNSYFKGLSELNQKESPRLKIASKFLNLIGVKNISTSDSIKIYGKSDLNLNGNFSMKNYLKDHRVFMMTVVAALTLGGNWKIYDADCFKTSFPSFLKLIRKVGGKYH